MTRRTGWRKYGAIRWFTVIGVLLVIVLVLQYAVGIDLREGAEGRNWIVLPLVLVALGVLELWHRVLPPADR